MGLDTRDYSRQGPYRDGGGIGGGFPWSFPLFTVFGIRVRVHLVFIIWLIFQLFQAESVQGLRWEAASIATLFAIILLHEFGHCFACRWVGGTADDVLLWPLGGLASCNPPPKWKAELITVLGGPAVNVVLAPVFAGLVLLAGVEVKYLAQSPLHAVYPGDAAWPGLLALSAYFMNIWLLAFNMLIPMFPMDAGRTLQCVLWAFMGRRRSLKIASQVGIGVAVLVGVWAITPQGKGGPLLLIAILGGMSCWNNLQMMKQGWAPEEEAPVVIERFRKKAVKARAKQQDADAELDRILAKIKDEGIDSLNGREKKFLERDTQRRRS